MAEAEAARVCKHLRGKMKGVMKELLAQGKRFLANSRPDPAEQAAVAESVQALAASASASAAVLKAERESLTAMYKAAMKEQDATFDELSFWARVAEVESLLASAQAKLDSAKLDLHLPASEGFLYAGGSDGVYFGMRDFWVESLQGDVRVEVAPLTLAGGQQVRPPTVAVTLDKARFVAAVQGLRLKGEKGSGVPDLDVDTLQVTATLSLTLPLQYTPHQHVEALLRGERGSGGDTPAPPAASDGTGSTVCGRYGRWVVGPNFAFSLSELHTRQKGGGLLPIPSSLTRWLVNTFLPSQIKAAALRAAPPELGDMLCAGQQRGSLSATVDLAGIPFAVLRGELRGITPEAQVPPRPPPLFPALPPTLSPVESPGGKWSHRLLAALLGVSSGEHVPAPLLAALRQRASQPHTQPLQDWAGEAPTLVQEQSRVLPADTLGPDAHALTGAVWLGLTPDQAGTLARAQSQAGQTPLACLHDILTYVRLHRPWILTLFPELEEEAAGAEPAAAVTLEQLPGSVAAKIMHWKWVCQQWQQLVDDALQVLVMQRAGQGAAAGGVASMRHTQAAAHAGRFDVRVMFRRAAALAGKPVAFSVQLHSLEGRLRLAPLLRCARDLALRRIDAAKAALAGGVGPHTRQRTAQEMEADLDELRGSQSLLQGAREVSGGGRPAPATPVSSPAASAAEAASPPSPGAGTAEAPQGMLAKAKAKVSGLASRLRRGSSGESHEGRPTSPQGTAAVSPNPFSDAAGMGGTGDGAGAEVIRSGRPAAAGGGSTISSASAGGSAEAGASSARVVDLETSRLMVQRTVTGAARGLLALPRILRKLAAAVSLTLSGARAGASGPKLQLQVPQVQAELPPGMHLPVNVLETVMDPGPQVRSTLQRAEDTGALQLSLQVPARSEAGEEEEGAGRVDSWDTALTVDVRQAWVGMLLDTAALAAAGCVGGVVNVADVTLLSAAGTPYGQQVAPADVGVAALTLRACPWLYQAADVQGIKVEGFLSTFSRYARRILSEVAEVAVTAAAEEGASASTPQEADQEGGEAEQTSAEQRRRMAALASKLQSVLVKYLDGSDLHVLAALALVVQVVQLPGQLGGGHPFNALSHDVEVALTPENPLQASTATVFTPMPSSSGQGGDLVPPHLPSPTRGWGRAAPTEQAPEPKSGSVALGVHAVFSLFDLASDVLSCLSNLGE